MTTEVWVITIERQDGIGGKTLYGSKRVVSAAEDEQSDGRVVHWKVDEMLDAIVKRRREREVGEP